MPLHEHEHHDFDNEYVHVSSENYNPNGDDSDSVITSHQTKCFISYKKWVWSEKKIKPLYWLIWDLFGTLGQLQI